MRYRFFHIVLMLLPYFLVAQREYHVFPNDHDVTPGMESGDGTMERPWDLQTALNQSRNVVNGGDTIWIHEGIYNGRYISSIASNKKGKKVRVSAFKMDKVTLNGNVASNRASVLQVKGKMSFSRILRLLF